MGSSLNEVLSIDRQVDVTDYLSSLNKITGKDTITLLLISDLIDSATEEHIRNIFNYTLLDPWVKGGLGFFLFTQAAERFSQRSNSEEQIRASEYLREKTTLNFLHDVYDIPNEYHEELLIDLHRVGTTSYIIRCKNVFALKIIKPKYFKNIAITNSTEAYRGRYPQSQYTPIVHESKKRFIIMDFVEGVTLREHIDRHFHASSPKRFGALEKIKNIEFLMNALCDALRFYEQQGIQHFDLSPDNIILEKQTRLPKLIDFGFNYLLVERVGSTYAFTRALSYVSPELQVDVKNGTPRSDVYSLGIILLEMLNDQAIRSQEIPNALDYIWSKYPDFADLAEEMIDGVPKNRFFYITQTTKIYEIIKEKVKSATLVYEEVELKIRAGWQRILQGLPTIIFGKSKMVFDLWRRGKKLKDGKASTEAKRLFRWSAATIMVHWVVLVLFGLFLIDDLDLWSFLSKIGPINLFSGGFISSVISHLNRGTGKENLPGRIVGLSFSILATQYYLNIFSTISARGLSKITEFWMRLNSFCFCIPILWAIVYNPRDWPICSAIGLWFVGCNNFFAYHTVLTAHEEVQRTFAIPLSTSSIDDFLNDFKTWWFGITLYGVALFAGYFLIRMGIAKDVGIYAIIVALYVNILNLFRNASTNKAPMIRRGLLRLFNEFKRLRIKRRLESTL